ncbi:hypothetical protein HELRODRAFT_165639 [Helobdella robusta]|uniref:RRM domain-containing protein n=1 Tax=Helobdella robusta TaxID=6412 RepID=T1EX40_HELRO|nr:hypothetical protein HELRODRAFT_165639 [Helobdella robusta]ESN91585.1 hypothetical protein HELRODRAFT_165639 [Helobdella robusta]
MPTELCHFHVFVGDLSPDVEPQHLQEAFAPFGETSSREEVKKLTLLEQITTLKPLQHKHAKLYADVCWGVYMCECIHRQVFTAVAAVVVNAGVDVVVDAVVAAVGATGVATVDFFVLYVTWVKYDVVASDFYCHKIFFKSMALKIFPPPRPLPLGPPRPVPGCVSAKIRS